MNEYEVNRLKEAKSKESFLDICAELLADTFYGKYPVATWILQDIMAQQIPAFFSAVSYEELTSKVERYINETIIPEAQSMYSRGNFYYGSNDFEWSYRFFQRYKLWLTKEYYRFFINLKGNRESRPVFYVIPRNVARFFAKLCDMRDFGRTVTRQMREFRLLSCLEVYFVCTCLTLRNIFVNVLQSAYVRMQVLSRGVETA